MTAMRGRAVDGSGYVLPVGGLAPLRTTSPHQTDFVVCHDGPGGPVVVKTARPSAPSEAHSRMGREVEFVGMLTEAGARDLPFVGAGVEPVPHVLTRYQPNRYSLSDHVRARGNTSVRSPEWIAALLAAVTDQLVEVERAGIVHRDVKPSNILVGADGSGGLVAGDVALIDLGHGWAPPPPGSEPLTSTGYAVGTEGWMGPAQLSAALPEPWWDILNLGIVAVWAALWAPANSPLPARPTTEAIEELGRSARQSPLPRDLAHLIEVALTARLAPSEFRLELETGGQASTVDSVARPGDRTVTAPTRRHDAPLGPAVAPPDPVLVAPAASGPAGAPGAGGSLTRFSAPGSMPPPAGGSSGPSGPAHAPGGDGGRQSDRAASPVAPDDPGLPSQAEWDVARERYERLRREQVERIARRSTGRDDPARPSAARAEARSPAVTVAIILFVLALLLIPVVAVVTS